MTIDDQGRRLWQRFQPAQRAAFFSCLLAGWLVHLYALTNLIPNPDGLSRVFDPQQMTISGRWFLHYASSLNGYTQMPAAIGLLSLLFLGIAAALTVELLSIRSSVLGGLTGVMMAVFPSLGFIFLYMFTASAYCLSILLAVLSVWLARRGRLGWLLGVLVLALSMGIYQAYVTMAISLSLLLVLRTALDPASTFHSTLRLGLRLMAYLAAGALLYYLILIIFLRMKDLELLSYLGMDAASAGYPIGQLPHLIVSAYRQVAAFLLFGFSSTHRLSLLTAANLLLALCAAGMLAARLLRRQGLETWRLLGALAMLALLPLGVNFGRLLSPYADPTPIMKYAFVALYLAVLLLADWTDRADFLPQRLCGFLLLRRRSVCCCSV